MAKSGSVWGIDLGQCALKALRCRAGDEPGTLVAEAFDYIEYPKMLGQPDANPAELLKEALDTFLSRNSVKGDKVAISVSGQSGLTRFIKLPPVESKKIPDIVKYEARQQIPFALEDVVWDYQQMAGGSVEDGFALETEVGLFAMKREQVSRALRPFLEANIEIDIVQLTPVALYNFVVFDQMPDIPPPEQYTPDDPPPSTIVMSLGADMSDLVVTNGYRVWQRTVNLGGNHFTKALTKQMKLTFAKAEHLKRNAMKAEDPKAVFQAMRPVFGELLGEVQRSLSFFQNIERTAKLGRVVPLGNAMKLRGLHKYLAQNLGLDVVEVEGYKQLTGPSVTASPAFKENMLSFGVCYGLCVQGLGLGKLSTNLLPREIVKERMIRAKKPWAVAAVATLILGCTLGFIGKWREWESAQLDAYAIAFSAAGDAATARDTAKKDFDDAKTVYGNVLGIGQRLAGMGERRVLWAEMLKAVNDCLPHDPPPEPGKVAKEIPISERNVIYIDSVDCQYLPDATAFIAKATPMIAAGAAPAAPTTPVAPAPGADGAQTPPPPGQPTPIAPATPPAPTADQQPPPAGDAQPAAPQADNSGWVIHMTGHHYHNNDAGNSAGEYLRKNFLRQLNEKSDLLIGDTDEKGQPIPISTKDLGIQYAVRTSTNTQIKTEPVLNPNLPATGAIGPNGVAAAQDPQNLNRFDFVVEFLWKPTPQAVRQKHRLEELKKKNEAAEAPKVASGG